MQWLLLMIFSLAVSAAPKPKVADPLRPLKDTLSRFQKTKLVDFQLEKKVHSELMETEKTFKGRAYLSGSLFRFETKEPQKSLVVYDGKILWVVQYPDPQLGGPTQVLKGRLQGKQKEQVILTELLTKGKLLESFNITKTGEEKGVTSYEGTPKDSAMNLTKVTVAVEGKKRLLKKLEYVDDVGNKTSLVVTEQKLQKDGRPDLFHYKPEKGAQVNDLL